MTDNATLDAWPDWSPGGTRVVFTGTQDHKRKIFTMNADRSGRAEVPYDLPCGGDDFS